MDFSSSYKAGIIFSSSLSLLLLFLCMISLPIILFIVKQGGAKKNSREEIAKKFGYLIKD
jgi:hypothetical protein